MHINRIHAPRPSRLPLVDMIAMITLAIGVGLATGVVLGGAVLLFSAGDPGLVSQSAAMQVASLTHP